MTGDNRQFENDWIKTLANKRSSVFHIQFFDRIISFPPIFKDFIINGNFSI